VAVLGRTPAALAETARLADGAPGRVLPIACDVTLDAGAAIRQAEVALGPPLALVNAAGTNVARRGLDVLSRGDFEDLVGVNLTGAFLCVRAVLPVMRRLGRGTIVNVISDAGVAANATAGAAYVASKFGLRGLTQAINAEERAHGIRACALLPGEINTPLLDKRPAPPPQDLRLKMLQPEDVAACVMLAIDLPDRAVVEELLVRPR
jgi:NAD(P)-dependent dehydrogenase (short-subunit alcohol dehydrogenase family)